MKTVIVTGIPRSGMSLTMQMLDAGGYPCLGEYPDYEPYSIGQIPYASAQGKVVKAVDIFQKFPPTGDYLVVRLRRNTEQQAKSHIKLLQTVFNAPVKASDWRHFEKSFKRDYEILDNWAKRQKGFIIIDFEDIINNPQITSQTIQRFLKYPLDTIKMANCVAKRSTDCYNGMLEMQLVAMHNDSKKIHE